MTKMRETPPQDLSEDQLDEAAGGYSLKKVQVTSYQTSSSAADDQPTEEVAFYYNKIKPSR
ncbi:MAG: hypothetical protein AAGC81_09985 [Pseudomonadota bacterium]